MKIPTRIQNILTWKKGESFKKNSKKKYQSENGVHSIQEIFPIGQNNKNEKQKQMYNTTRAI